MKASLPKKKINKGGGKEKKIWFNYLLSIYIVSGTASSSVNQGARLHDD